MIFLYHQYMQHIDENGASSQDRPTILAVDDEASYLRFLTTLLTAEGYHVVTASECAQALAMVRSQQPDLVLLDLHLAAGNDGAAICREIKSDPVTSFIPVIAITGMNDNRTRLACLSSGANEFLAKPVDPAELLLRVRNTLRLRQAEEVHARNLLLVSHQAVLEEKNRELEAALREISAAEAWRVAAEVQRDLIQARLRRLEQTEMIGKVAAGVAHEVRNPLHAIMSLTEALCQKVGGGEEYAPFTTHIRSQVVRVADLMRDLLDFGKPLDRERVRPVTAAEICRNVEERWEDHPAFATHPLYIEQREADPESMVLGDPAKFEQAVLNLLENGADHSPEGAPLRLSVSTVGEGILSLEVIDAGSGIPEAARGRIFEPFFTTRRKGTGLGLSIVQRIVEDCGGRVELRPNCPGPGTSALLSIPIAREAHP